MGNFERAVFISYAWGGKSEEIVNKIDQSLQKRDITIIRDKRDLGYKGSIQEFMERIGQGNCIIVVISDKYLRSPNCMFELVEIAENKQFHDRIFPLVLEDASIYDPVKRLEYVRHWEMKRAELAEAMKSVDPANLQGIRDDIDNYDRFRDEISGLTSILKDMNTLTADIHQDSDFNALYESIEKRLHPTESKAGTMTASDSSPKKEQEKKPDEAGKGTTIHIGGNVTGPVQTNPVFEGPVHFGNNINAQEYVQGNKYQTGDITNSASVILGDHAQVHVEQNQGASAEDILEIFSMLRKRVDKMSDGDDRAEAKETVDKLQAEAKKGQAADVFQKAETAMRGMLEASSRFKNLNNIPKVAEAISPHVKPVKEAVDALVKTAKAPRVSAGVKLQGPMSGTGTQTGSSSGITVMATVTVRF